MMDRASAAGWVIMVISATGGRVPSVKYFNAAIPNAEEAIQATKKRPDSSPCMRMQAVRPLSADEIERLGLKTGETGPA
jgi:hypothetical protein